jgi:ABC-type protease/lipase transport system fused ATPase/permease subunit
MDENASDEAVIEAAQKANIHNIILRLPDGYDTKIGVGGIILSSGQRQLIGLARAFFGNPSLLILDEPNSSLDKNGKSALLDAILEAKISNITTIIISDDQELLDIADKILVLNNGKIEQFGETDAILNNIKTTDTAIMIKKVHHAN